MEMRAVIWGLLIPFIGTAGGAACVFFLKKDLRAGIQRALTGFAAGVMVAASIWSLIVPAIEQSAEKGRWAFLPAFIGFWLGILFLLLLDHIIPHLHRGIDRADQTEGPKSSLNRTIMMVLAVTLHNIPEGMAVGVVYAGLLSGSANITAGGALALALGIAIQNFPEGAIISMPLFAEGKSKPKSFRLGVLSGAVDPGDVCRETFQYRRRVLCRRLQPDDGAGRGTWMMNRRMAELRAAGNIEILITRRQRCCLKFFARETHGMIAVFVVK